MTTGKVGGIYISRSSDLNGSSVYDVYVNGGRDGKITGRKGYWRILPTGRYTIQTRRSFFLSHRESNTLMIDVIEDHVAYIDARTRILAFSKDNVVLRKSYILPIQLLTSQGFQSLKEDTTLSLPKPIDLRNYLTLALTPLLSAIILSFFPYLHPNPAAMGISLTIIGCFILGYAVHKVTSSEIYPINQEQTSRFLKHSTIGLLFFASWFMLKDVMPYQSRDVMFFILMYAIGELLLAIGHLISKGFRKSLAFEGGTLGLTSSNLPETPSPTPNRVSTMLNWPVFTKVAVATAGVTAFLASLLQILQILQLIP